MSRRPFGAQLLEVADQLLRDLQTSDAAAYDRHAFDALFLLKQQASRRREDWRPSDAPHYLIGWVQGTAKGLRRKAEALLREADRLDKVAAGLADGIEAARTNPDDLRMRYVVEHGFDPGVDTNLARSLPRAYGPIWTVYRKDTGEAIGRRRSSSADIAIEAVVSAAVRAGAALPPGTEVYATSDDGGHS